MKHSSFVIYLGDEARKLRRGLTTTQRRLEPVTAGKSPLLKVLGNRGTYAFAVGKGLTDGVWWFYLFYLPQFLNRNYGLDLKGSYWYIVTVYVVSSVGSILGGSRVPTRRNQRVVYRDGIVVDQLEAG